MPVANWMRSMRLDLANKTACDQWANELALIDGLGEC